MNENIIQRPVPQVRPWVRYWARFIDIYLCSFFVGASLGFFPPLQKILLKTSKFFLGGILIDMFSLFILVFLEAYLLSEWGMTPGKWLLKVTVRDKTGQKLTYSDALDRSATVWWKGLALGFPLLMLITMIMAWDELTEKRITSWDKEGEVVISHGEIGPARTIITILFFTGMFILRIFLMIRKLPGQVD